MSIRALLFMLLAFAMPVSVGAQVVPGIDVSDLATQTDKVAAGWAQIQNIDELREFGLYVLTTVILTAAIVYHPVRQKARKTLDDLMMPRLFFLYALIGMAVGFLVIEHGYIIGFVVFGIGALLRFRSNLDDPIDTVEMILVTVVGLTVGLDLPVMAMLLAAVSWVFIWFGGRSRGVEVSLKASSEPDVLAAYRLMEQATSASGWKVIHRHHVPGKNGLSALFQFSGRFSDHEIEAKISEVIPDGIEYKIKL